MSLSAIDKALDHTYSIWIRCASKWRCQDCGIEFNPPKDMLEIPNGLLAMSQGLHCSHFWGIGSSSIWTRWNGMNADSLCWGCHTKFEHLKSPGQEYRMKKKESLGTQMFTFMEWLSKRTDPMYDQVKEIRLYELLCLIEASKYETDWLYRKYNDLRVIVG